MNLEDYISLYLISNEVIMGKILSITENEYVLDNAVYVRFGINEITRNQYAYMVRCNPLYTQDNILSFSKKHVIYASPVDAQFVELFEKFHDLESKRGEEKTVLYNDSDAVAEDLSQEDEMLMEEFLNSIKSSNNTIH